MALLDKATFETIYAQALGTFQDNTTREITEGDLRQFAQDIADSLVFGQVTSGTVKLTTYIPAVDVLQAFSTPVVVAPQPIAGFVNVPVMFVVDIPFNSISYSVSTDFRFEIDGVPVSATNSTILLATQNQITFMPAIGLDEFYNVGEKPIVFKVQTADPLLGNSLIRVTAIYSVVEYGVPA